MQKRFMSAAAVTVVAAISLAGCSKDDVQNAVDKGKDAASQAATSKAGQKAIQKAKDKASAMMNGSEGASASASGSAAAGQGEGGVMVDLGKFSKNRKAKIVGTYYTKKRAGKPGTFEVNVVAVKANKVSACVGAKGKRSQLVIVRKGKVAAVRKGTATCA